MYLQLISLPTAGRNNGKKLMAVRIMKHTLEIIHLTTDSNPIQVSAARYSFLLR